MKKYLILFVLAILIFPSTPLFASSTQYVYLEKLVLNQEAKPHPRYTASGVGGFSILDLSTNAQKQAGVGYALVTYNQIQNLPDAVYLGTDLTQSLTAKQAIDVAGKLDIKIIPLGYSMSDIVWDKLGKDSDPLGITGLKPIMPDDNLNRDLYIGGQKVKTEKFDIKTSPIKDKIISVIQNDNAKLFADGVPLHTRQKVLGALVQQFNVDDYTVFLAKETPKVGYIQPSTTYTDNFNRADGGLGANWTQVFDSLMVISSNTVKQSGGVPGTGNFSTAIYNSSLSTADHYSQMKYVGASLTTPFFTLEINVRSSSDGNYYYAGCLVGSYITGPPSGHQLYKNVGGSGTDLIVQTTPTGDINEVIKTSVSGSTIHVYKDGVDITGSPVTDTDVTGYLQAGFSIYDNPTVGAGVGDDWEAGDLIVVVPSPPHLYLFLKNLTSFLKGITILQ